MSTITEAVALFRSAALEKADFAGPARRDHALHRQMRDAFRELQTLGAPGQAAFRKLLDDASPHVRIWVAAELLSRGDQEAQRVLEKLADEPGLLGFNATTTLNEFKAGRLRSPFG
jgi:hypothetical protein